MALLFVESFDWIGATGRSEYLQKWTSWAYGQPADADFDAAFARTSGKGLRMSSAVITRGINCPGNVIVVGFGMKRVSGSYWELQFTTGGQDGVPTFRFSSDGSVTVTSYGNPHPAKITGGGWFPTNQWRYVEVKVTHSQSSGSYEIRCDGAVIGSWTGLDTLYGSLDSPITAITLNCWSASPVTYFDDIYVLDNTGATCNDFLGDVRISGILPSTGNGSNVDFDPSAAGSPEDHGAMVDDVGPDGDTTYLSSSTVGHIDTWNYPALGYTGVVKAVAMNLHARKTDAGPRALAAVTRPASTNRIHGTDKYISTVYLNHQSFWEVNPEDSAAWEIADIDAAEFGVKLTV